MHELSIVEALIEQVGREVKRAGLAGKIHRVELSVGRFSGVNPGCLQFAFNLLTEKTPLEKTEIVIHEPKAVCRCQRCNARIEVDEFVAQCPECGSPEVILEGGRDLTLQSIDVEES
ncbi:MAG: hydrogenase maturation nickel metallochaperone HypA [Pirellulales bacterium]|nr:hydrogenase maturation nickel metallochaperone HypA [Pirellulales bacterium]